ncbi:YqiA/YcfP family alpha/beta fold hydrolase [Paenibacillus pinistramenti]|uniref:YqiA/YcfP family alpha/beta fold hydrolase n=1 Tax=Paenibacillus pinistramenti TaxID=1768003 RepID=UPI0013968F65|nr:YqiA/YcfP family alpha/beta fold hydrolase [Paenibacillus pinistramenti]
MDFEFWINSCNALLVEKYINEEEKKVVIDYTTQSKYLYVYFGGVKSGLGIPFFEFYNISREIQSKRIFIRDFSQAWYHYGLKTRSISNIEQLAQYLDSLIEQSQARKVILVGNSMGGYAAILLSLLLKTKTQVVAFNPQTFIGEKLFSEMGESRWMKKVRNIPSDVVDYYLDLSKLIEGRNNPDTKIDIYYSESDKHHALRLDGYCNISLNYFPSVFHHDLVKELRDSSDLIQILESYQI